MTRESSLRSWSSKVRSFDLPYSVPSYPRLVLGMYKDYYSNSIMVTAMCSATPPRVDEARTYVHSLLANKSNARYALNSLNVLLDHYTECATIPDVAIFYRRLFQSLEPIRRKRRWSCTI